MQMKAILYMTIAVALAYGPSTSAHHSDAGIDDEKVVSLQGSVTGFRWRQPHVYISLDVEENGETENWDIQLIALNILSRQGWHAKSLVPGDKVALEVNPASSGRPYGKLVSILRADGSAVAVNPAATAREVAKATSIAGRWTAQRPTPANGKPPPPPPPRKPASGSGPLCSSGFDCFFRTNLILTAAGKAAANAYDPLSNENPESTCVGRPTPAALVSSRGYLLEFDLMASEKIVIRSEWFNEERTIWMDGRSHPDAAETFATGHSIGHWEDDTLIVDTRNFDDHRSPYQIGVPSGSGKHVIERYRLNDDGLSMWAEFTLQDPEFIAEPFTDGKNLYFAPHLEMVRSDCDLENTGRFLK